MTHFPRLGSLLVLVRSFATKKGKAVKSISSTDATVDFQLSKYTSKMHKSLEALQQNLEKIRVGRANPSLLDSISIQLDGKQTLLSKVAQIHVKDAHTLMVVVPEEQVRMDSH
jgi:hypothetical protein